MYKGIEELKISYEKEIKRMEENGYSIVTKSLREEMLVEIDNLKEQYEELRQKGVDKIKHKFNKNY